MMASIGTTRDAPPTRHSPAERRGGGPATGGDAARAGSGDSLAARYCAVRSFTETLAAPLAPEDCVVQTMADVSPTKWHLAHVSWFFETFILKPSLSGYRELDPMYPYLFNSYYVQAGERHCRDQRGYISRPTVREVYEYRAHVDRHMLELLDGAGDVELGRLAPLVEIGLNHEQQHQELLLTDIKHVFSVNPLRPAYASLPALQPGDVPAQSWIRIPEGLYDIGHAGQDFAYDNEGPRHRHFLEAFEIADRPVTNADYLAFMEDGGYARAEFWLSEGWAVRQARDWTEPFYWERRDGRWMTYTLGGMRHVDPAEPACHISYYEADAFARWAGARLPTEEEWEVAARNEPRHGNFVESGRLHPAPVPTGDEHTGLRQVYGDVWEWTRSQYSPYPGYRPAAGALGEYNGKFMCNQFVLRGGSCATPVTHIRATYRNFFPADACWQLTGLRLARDV
jgi:ergothioneine biosynthesis protein EgtB